MTSSCAAARLVAGYGGSLSGEHGDGRARSELLPLMYSPEALRLFAAVKHTFDPDNVLNPGVLVDPRPLDADLRVPAAPLLRRDLALAYHHDGGNFTQAVHRCTGVGKCRADNTASGGVMCPSYQATREEKDSTRGRARVLQEMINGTAVTGGWRSPEVHEALDLCLSCKGCASDCPTGVDMAAFKSEVLHQSYRRRLRPPSHYSLGWLPRWARIASKAPGLVNADHAHPGRRAARALGRRRRQASHHPAVRAPDVPVLVLRHRGGPGADRRSGAAVRRLVHQLLHPRGRARHGAGARGRRLPPATHREAAVLRADVDLHRPVDRGEEDPGPNGSRVVGIGRCSDRRHGALVHGRVALGCNRTARRRRRPGGRNAPARWRSCSPSGAGSRRRWRGSRLLRNRIATTTR